MPLQKCSVDGKSGWKYGESGHCYTGPGARQKAIQQMRAIKVSQSKSKDLMEQVDDIIEQNKSTDTNSGVDIREP